MSDGNSHSPPCACARCYTRADALDKLMHEYKPPPPETDWRALAEQLAEALGHCSTMLRPQFGATQYWVGIPQGIHADELGPIVSAALEAYEKATGEK